MIFHILKKNQRNDGDDGVVTHFASPPELLCTQCSPPGNAFCESKSASSCEQTK